MVQYTLTQNSDIVLTVPGKDSPQARSKAMDQLIKLVEDGKIPANLSKGFSPQQFVEVEEPTPMTADANVPDSLNSEDALNQAVQVLNNFATLKLKVQASKTEAMKVRAQVDSLFTDEPVDEAEIERLKEGFKVLKTFAQANMRYSEARPQAEQARMVLDQALSLDSTSSSPKSAR
ncbi:MAG: hypothetical protein SFY66_05850 [Oculatellaceae cyanobacterium bins.114]|nr:hypothetical protein [Oculatellaceae cyanobacterium bins.114]